jgi:secreted trypsin-like serine protease
MRRVLFVCLFAFAFVTSAPAMVGGAPQASGEAASHAVLIVGSRGTSCTATLIARDLLLTAAHCAMPDATYKLVLFDAAHHPTLKDIVRVAQHPQFDLKTMLAHRATADVALMKLAEPLPASFALAPLAETRTIAPGDPFVVAGYGVTVRGDGRTGGTLREARLVAIGKPGTLQLRLVDPATGGTRPGLSACTGDSGGPASVETNGRLAVVGVVSWSTGPNMTAGCGGLTGITPLARYRDWIVDTARAMGSPVGF